MYRTLRREDRPAHPRKAADEKRRDTIKNVMVRLEPGRITFGVLAFDAAKTYEGMHLVAIATHGFLKTRGSHDIFVGRVLHQPRFVLEPPQQAIEKIKPRRVAMTDHRLRTFNEIARDGKRFIRGRTGRWRKIVEKLADISRRLAPGHVSRCNAGAAQGARGLAPAGKISRG